VQNKNKSSIVASNMVKTKLNLVPSKRKQWLPYIIASFISEYWFKKCFW